MTIAVVCVPCKRFDGTLSDPIPLYFWFTLFQGTYPRTFSFSCNAPFEYFTFTSMFTSSILDGNSLGTNTRQRVSLDPTLLRSHLWSVPYLSLRDPAETLQPV